MNGKASRDGRISFAAKTFLYADSDDQIAAVLTHEFAHITMNHVVSGNPRYVEDLMSDTPEYWTLRRKRQKINDGRKMIEIDERIKELELEKGITEFTRFTLKEQEADEVGFEIFVRSGFNIDKFTFMPEHYVKYEQFGGISAENKEQLIAECIKIKTEERLGKPVKGEEKNSTYRTRPGIGQTTHPEPCWRVHHMTLKEPEFHKYDIAKLGAVPRPAKLQNPSLEDVKEEVKEKLRL